MKVFLATEYDSDEYYSIVNSVFLNEDYAKEYCEIHSCELKEYETFDEKFSPGDWRYKVETLIYLKPETLDFSEKDIEFRISRVANSLPHCGRTALHSFRVYYNFEVELVRYEDKNISEEEIKSKYTKQILELATKIKELIKVQNWTPDEVRSWLREEYKN